MSNPKINPRTMAQAAKISGHHCMQVEAMALDTARKIHEDQAEWLDSVMKDLLPPHLYEAAKKMELLNETEAYAKKHGIIVTLIPDTFRMRVMLHGKVHAEFQANLLVDGEPIKREIKSSLDSSQN
jgi:hypothetical protein